MISDTLQSLPVDILNVGIVHAAELVAHDPARGVFILERVGERGERVPQSVEGDASGPLDLQFIAEGGKFFDQVRDFGHFGIARAEDKMVVSGSLCDDRREGFDSLRPQRHVSHRHSLSADGVDASINQVKIDELERGAVGGAHASVDSQQDLRLQITSRFSDQCLDGSGFKFAILSPDAQLRNPDLRKTLTESNGVDQPSALLGMIEHGDDAGAFTVVGVSTDLAQQEASIDCEVVGPEIAHQTTAAHLLQESPDGPAVVGEMPSADIAGGVPCFLFVDKQVGHRLQRQRVGISHRARFATSVQVMLDPFVFGQGSFAIAAATEVIERPVDSFLESPVASWLDRKTLRRCNLVTTSHPGTLNVDGCFFKCIQIGIHATCAIVAKMDETLENKPFGSVAQRLEQGTHNPLQQTNGSENPGKSGPEPSAKTAQVPNKSPNSSRLNTRKKRPPHRQNSVMEAVSTARQFSTGDALAIFGSAVPNQNPPAVCGFKVSRSSGAYVYFLLCWGRVVYVGQTRELMKRIGDHTSGEKRRMFDEVRFIKVPSKAVDHIERQCIRHFNPPLNRWKPTPMPANGGAR